MGHPRIHSSPGEHGCVQLLPSGLYPGAPQPN
ncbi:unnamed protein product, partial [Gulo gulo]